LETLFAVDGGVDLGGRKNEPIEGGGVLQPSHFTELEESGGFFLLCFAVDFASSLQGLEHGEVLLNGAVEALLIEGKELELLRLHGEDARAGEGSVDLYVIGELATIFVETEGEEVVFDRADPIESPAVGGDALGKLGLHGSLGREVFDESFRERVMGGTVFVGHRGDLAGEAVAERVEAGALLALFRRTGGQKGVAAVCFQLFFGDHGFSRLRATTAGREIGVGQVWNQAGNQAGMLQGLGMQEFREYFRGL